MGISAGVQIFFTTATSPDYVILGTQDTKCTTTKKTATVRAILLRPYRCNVQAQVALRAPLIRPGEVGL